MKEQLNPIIVILICVGISLIYTTLIFGTIEFHIWNKNKRFRNSEKNKEKK